MKLNIGCGQDIIAGYENYDLESTDASVKIVSNYADINYDSNTVEKIRCLHTLSQIPSHQVFALLSKWYEWLIEGGELYVELIDNYLVSNNFINGFTDIAEYSKLIYGSNSRTAFTIDSFQTLVEEIGFKVLDKGLYSNSFYMTLIK